MHKKISEVWIRKASTTWYVTIDGKQVSLKIKGKQNKHLAEIERAKLLVKFSSQDASNLTDEKITLATMAEVYLAEVRNRIAAETLRKRKGYVDLFVSKFGKKLPAEIQKNHIQELISSNPQWNSTTQGIVLGHLSAWFSSMVDSGLIPANPVSKIKKPQSQVRGEDVVISSETYEKLLENAKCWVRDIIQFLWLTGCRPSECLGATCSEYVASKNQLVKQFHKTAHKGKKRKIWLCREARLLVEKLKMKWTEGLLFRSPTGKAINSKRLHKELQTLKKKCGINDPVLAYGFRHSWACRKIQAGKSPYLVAAALGHTSTRFLEKHYADALKIADGMFSMLDDQAS